MINREQENQVTVYLASKKLSPQMLAEVKDHFILQITDVMDRESINFQEAFLKTKLSWKKELEIVRADLLSFKKIARIEKSVLQMRFRKITMAATGFTGAGFLLLCISSDLFMMLQVLVLITWFSMILYTSFRKGFTFTNYATMSFHPLLIRDLFFGLAVFCFVRATTSDDWEILDQHLTNIFCMYSLAVQLQLLYFNSRKVNVLI